MTQSKLANISIVFMGAILAIFLLERFQSFLRPFTIAVILTLLFAPWAGYSKEQKHKIVARTIAIIVALAAFAMILGPLIAEESVTAGGVLGTGEKAMAERLLGKAELDILGRKVVPASIIDGEKLDEAATRFAQTALQAIGKLFSELILVMLFLVFMLPTHRAFLEKIEQNLAPSRRPAFRATVTRIEDSIRRYLSAKFVISLATGLACLAVMVLFGVRFPILFAFLTFMLNFIPNLGSIIAVALIVLTHFLTAGWSLNLVIVAVLLTIIQFTLGNIVEPLYSGKRLELSPVVVILSLLFWGSIWGVPGMLFAIPLTSVIKIVLENIESTKGIVPYMS